MKTTNQRIKQIGALSLAITLVATTTANAGGLSDASRASIDASIAIPVTLVRGSMQLFKDAGQFSVTGIKTVGNVSTIALRGVASGVEASVQISAKALEGSAIAAGVVVQAVLSGAGILLVAAGKALMFLPNEIGQSLLHHSRARD